MTGQAITSTSTSTSTSPRKRTPPKRKPLKKLEIDIATKTAQGKTGLQIAKETGTSAPTVCRRLKREEIQALVNDIQARLIDQAAAKSAQNIIDIVNTENSKLINQKLKYSDKVLQSIGIMPAHTQSIVFNTLINQSNNLVGSDILQILQALNIKRISDSQESSEPAIDAELIDQLQGIVGDKC